jgi:hypothetical protein
MSPGRARSGLDIGGAEAGMKSRFVEGRRCLALCGLLGALAGCAGGLPLGPDVMVPGQSFVAAQGEADVVVRTYVIDETGTEREVAGATCEVTTVLYSARLVTPVRLRLPSFGPQSPDLVIECAAGALRGGATRPIQTIWRSAPAYGPGPWGWNGYGPGGWGPGMWGPWGAWPQPSYPVWQYPGVEIRLM